MAETCCGESVSAHSIINLHNKLRYSIMPIFLRNPQIIKDFFLDYLETSILVEAHTNVNSN